MAKTTGKIDAGALLLSILLLGAAACGKGTAGSGPAARAGKARAAPAAPRIAIELRRGQEPRELVRIGTRGVIIGPSSGPLARKFFVDPRRADVVWYFLRTYAPFEAKTPEGEIVFQGQGKIKAGATEQRMIREWSRQVAAEAAGGRGGAAYGLVLAWHQGGSSLDCQDVAIYLAGEAVATSCGWDGEVRGRLEPGALGRVYDWFDRLQPFQEGGAQTEDSLRPGALETRLIFAGKGTRPAAAGEQADIQSFAARLYSELNARRPGAPPPAAPAAPATPQGKTPPAPVEPPATRLLLPPGALNPRPQEIILQLPEKPPPPPSSQGAQEGAPRRPAPVPAAPVQPPA
jgi:hypothetical protein